MKRLAILSFAPVEPEAIEVYRERYERKLQKYGVRRFNAAVEWCLDNLREYPKPAEFADAVAMTQPDREPEPEPMTAEQLEEGRELFEKFMREALDIVSGKTMAEGAKK